MIVLGRAIRRAIAAARRAPFAPIAAVTTIALSLLLIGAVQLVVRNLETLAVGWGEGVHMAVYLSEGVDPARTQQILGVLRRLPGAEEARIVDSHDAYGRLRRALGRRSDLLDGVEEGLFPTSIEVRLKPGVARMLDAHPAVERLRQSAGVEGVEVMGEWAERLSAVRRMLRSAGAVAGLLVAGACLYMIASTIRLGVFARRQEIEVLKLVGATDGFVKAPFLVEGVFVGACGAAIAALLLYALYRAAAPEVNTLLGGWLLAGPLRFFSPEELACAIGTGALVGLLGSALALGRYVRA